MPEGLQAEGSESEAVEERRRTERLEVEFPVRIQAPVRADGEALELSTGGLRLELGEDLSHAVHISLEFSLPGTDRRIGALADVRWHKKMGPKSRPRWVYGLRFSDLTSEDETAILEHIEAEAASAASAE